MKPEVTSMEGQRKIAEVSLCISLAIAFSAYITGRPNEAAGVLFGCALMVLNLLVMSQITKLCELTKLIAAPELAKVVTFISYQIRFVIFVTILYLVITKAGTLFAIGTFIGFIIPKFPMGFLAITGSGEDWWLQRKTTSVETSSGPEKILTPLERELSNSNPFQFDMVEWEMKKCR